MPLPKVDQKALEEALRQFDIHYRGLPEWAGWETKAPQRFGLRHNGLQYPPKKIISLATGVPVSSFSGGRQSNEYLRQRGFEVVALDEQGSGPLDAPRFIKNKVYDRRLDINGPYGGSYQNGISASNRTPAIFLFTGETGEKYGYSDNFDTEGVFSYAGEGQVGDMQLSRGNLAITTHAADGRALHVFRSLAKGKGHRYVGEFSYVNHEFGRGPDRDQRDRRIIIFHLVPIDLDVDDDASASDNLTPERPLVSDIDEARRKAIAAFVATEGAGGRQAKRTLYLRSKAVRDYVLLRSRGTCESCHEPAPFERPDGSMYLEPHHTMRVSDGGLDHPRFVAAICPTCHREIHYGRDGRRRNAELTEYLAQVEPLT